MSLGSSQRIVAKVSELGSRQKVVKLESRLKVAGFDVQHTQTTHESEPPDLWALLQEIQNKPVGSCVFACVFKKQKNRGC